MLLTWSLSEVLLILFRAMSENIIRPKRILMCCLLRPRPLSCPSCAPRTTPWRRIGGLEVQLHPFFDLGTRRGWVTSFTPCPSFKLYIKYTDMRRHIGTILQNIVLRRTFRPKRDEVQVEVFPHLEDGDSRVLRNVGVPPQHYTLQPRRPRRESSLPWNPRNLITDYSRYLYEYELTNSWSRTLLEKLTVGQLVQKLLTLDETWMCIAMFMAAFH
jgi:hypothetical protein